MKVFGLIFCLVSTVSLFSQLQKFEKIYVDSTTYKDVIEYYGTPTKVDTSKIFIRWMDINKSASFVQTYTIWYKKKKISFKIVSFDKNNPNLKISEIKKGRYKRKKSIL